MNDKQIPEIQKLEKIKGTDPVLIKIDSYGGRLSVGRLWIDAIRTLQRAGVQVHCLNARKAESMALYIYMYCDQRWAYWHSVFMFHPIRRQIPPGRYTAAELRQHWIEVDALEVPFKSKLRSMLPLDKETFEYHYSRETKWSARTLFRRGGFFRLTGGVK